MNILPSGQSSPSIASAIEENCTVCSGMSLSDNRCRTFSTCLGAAWATADHPCSVKVTFLARRSLSQSLRVTKPVFSRHVSTREILGNVAFVMPASEDVS